MSSRCLTFLVSTFLLLQIISSTFIENEIADGDDERLCNNLVAAWVRAEILELKKWTLDEVLKAFKALLDKPNETSLRSELSDEFTVEASEFVRDVEARRDVDPAFNLEEAIKSAKRLTTYEVGQRVNVSMMRRVKKILREFGTIFEQFATSLSSEERKDYKELFALRDQMVNTNFVYQRFGYLDDLDKRCIKCC